MTSVHTRPAPSAVPTDPDRRRGAWRFARHYLSMVTAMYAGMIVLSPVYAAGAARLGYPDPWQQLPVLSAVVMAVEMTVPMALLMLWRRHGLGGVAEMAAAMLLPTLAAAALFRGGLVPATSVMTIAHLGMFPAMFLAMALRYRQYAGAGTHH